MAEKATSPFSLVVALTYSDATPEGRDGARMFCYKDVQDFMKRLRIAAQRLEEMKGSGVTPWIRFICAGEQGSRNNRCHWHLVLYSNVNLLNVGQFFGLRNKIKVEVFDDKDKISPTISGHANRAKRLDWSLWPLGYSVFQNPDQGAMGYVLSYCLKDQFTEEKSRDTMRAAKSENFATGLFRMSKRPAIGEAFLIQKMERLHALGAVLPSLKLQVPEMGGYWQPNGSFRKRLLWFLTAINQQVRWRTGADAPQWASLVESCKEIETDLEILNGPEITEEQSLESKFEFRTREIAEAQRVGAIYRTCGSALPCDQCLSTLSAADLERLGVAEVCDPDGSNWRYESLPGEPSIYEKRSERSNGPNPYCFKQFSPAYERDFKRAFPKTHAKNTRASNL